MLAEKVVSAAQQLLRSTAELKRKAFLANSGAESGREHITQRSQLSEELQSMKAEIAEVLGVSCLGSQDSKCVSYSLLLSEGH